MASCIHFCDLSYFPPGDIDGLQLEMSSLLKELHCPYKAVLAGILKGQLQIKKHNLQLLCV
jgi:hypothetical protein